MDEEGSRYSLVVRNLQEVVGDAELRSYLSGEKAMEVYWGTATTGKPHVAYFVPIIKIAEMLHAGLKVTILFADLHAYLDNMKSPWHILYHRATYYETIIKGMLEAVGVRLDRLHFIRGSEYELSRAYSEDVYKISADTSIRDARKAGAEVVKQVSNPLVSGLLYPLLQALDEEYLHVDAQFGGVDQRKIFMLCERILPRLGYKKRVHLMNPMVPGLTGGKMSASEADSKIDMLESSESVRQKLAKASCPPGQTASDGNGVLAFVKFVIFPMAHLSASSTGLKVGDRVFTTYEELEAAYVAGGDAGVSADALRTCVFDHLDSRMEVVRRKFALPQFASLPSDAYPTDDDKTHVEESRSTASLTAAHDDRMASIIARLATTEQHLEPFEDVHAVASLLAGVNVASLADRLTATGRKCLRCLWSVSPGGLPHLGHTLPLRVLARLSRVPGVHVIILVDDITAFLEGNCSWDLREPRCVFVETMLRAAFKSFEGNDKALTVFRGHEYKCEGTYMLDLYRLVSYVPERDAVLCSGMSPAALQASDDSEGPGVGLNLSSLLLPCTSLLDTYHLGADLRLASPHKTQWHLTFARQFLPLFDAHCKLPVFATHPMLPCLSASVEGDASAFMTSFVPTLRDPRVAHSVSAQAVSKAAADRCLPLVEPPPPGVSAVSLLPGLKKRLKQSFCEPGNVLTNPLLEIFKLVVLPELKPQGKTS
ncbi:unnamed protein product [Mesocestoides corti]|uniref:Tyrosine--tRNA ligase n=1 Tax=Mesocestoides corti TaxID=53468 RepID=A0A0R3UI46_MESCO|nr:unnamed protein product [Mesocestoides corti]